MRKIIMCCLLVVFCGPSALFCRHGSSEKSEASNENYEKISLSEFSQLLYQGLSTDKMKNLLVECPAGSELPFKFSLRGDVFCFEPTQDVKFNIKLIKTCYLRYQSKVGLVFSTDLSHWTKFADFLIGKAAAAFTIENQIPIACFEMELNERAHRWEVPIGYNNQKYSYTYCNYPTPYHSWSQSEPTSQ